MGGKPLYKVRKITDLKDMINQCVNLYENKTAFKIKISKDPIEYKEITYKQFGDEINYLGNALLNLGLKGETINLISNNRYEWNVSYLATVNGVGIVSPLDRALTNIEIKSLVTRSNSKAIIFESKYLSIIQELLEDTNSHNLKYYICMDKVDDSRIIYYGDLIEKGKNLVIDNKDEFSKQTIDPEVMSVILFTSGTTSLSKAVMLSHKNIVSNIMDCKTYLNITEKDVTLSFLPLHHTFECTANFLLIMYSGATIVFCDGIRYVAKNINEYKVSCTISVPALYENMYKRLVKTIKENGKWDKVQKAIKIFNTLDKIGINTFSLRRKAFKDIYSTLSPDLWLFVSGAAGIDKNVVKGFNDLGLYFFQGYGLTETSPVLACENVKMHKPGSVGTPLPNCEIEIRNKDENGIGEIYAKAPYVMLGYYQNKEATKEVLNDNWFSTGDLGYLDKDGFLFIQGRKKNVIVLKNGKNVFPEEIEFKINQLPLVSESMVFGKSDKNGDLDLWVKIVYNSNQAKTQFGEINEEELYKILLDEIKTINKTMPAYKYVRDIILTDKELIKTTTQKIKRFEEIKNLN